MQRSAKSVFAYLDFREFLRDAIADKKILGGLAWSLRALSRRVGLAGHSMLSMILKGVRHPSDLLARRLAEELKLDPTEASFFIDLIELDRVRHNARKVAIVMDRLRTRYLGKPGSSSPLWHLYAVRELIRLNDFREDVDWLEGKLNHQVSPGEVRSALDFLVKNRIVKRGDDGVLRSDTGGLIAELDGEAQRLYHEDALSRALAVIRSTSSKNQELCGTTLAIPSDRMDEARTMIQKFRSDFLSAMRSGKCDSVYHLEVAFFPITGDDDR